MFEFTKQTEPNKPCVGLVQSMSQATIFQIPSDNYLEYKLEQMGENNIP